MPQRPTTTQNLQGDGTIASGRDTNIGVQNVHLPGQQAPEPPQRLTHGLSTAVHERFIGRTDLLKALKKELRPGKNAAILSAQAVHADGGVGKTTLAAHLGWQLFEKKIFDYVLLLGAVRPGDLDLELSGLCETHRLNLPAQAAKEPEARYRGVLAFLKDPANARRTLLILDGADADEARAAVHALRQELPGCAFLITSRHSDWGKGITGFPLDLFSEAEALDFLRDRLADVSASDDTLRSIAKALDHLPLGLEIATSYIQDTHLRPADWLAEWQQAPAATLNHHNADKLDYPVSLARVWEQSVARLPTSARELLSIFAWIAPRPSALPLKPFEALELWPQLRGDLALLAKASLIRWEDDPSQILIHRLLQTCMRAAFSAAERQATLAGCLSLLYHILPDAEWSRLGWTQWEALSPHIQAVLAVSEGETFEAAETSLSRLLNEFGNWYYHRAQHAHAEPLYRRALRLDEANYGPDHPTVAIRLGNLAQLLKATNRLAEAEEPMRRALKIDEASYGPDHPNVAIRLNNLAALLMATNRLSDAEDAMRRALKIDEVSCGPGHPNVAIRLSNLAQLLKLTNRLAEAEEPMRRALKIDETNYGPDHPTVAIRLNNLAALFHATNRLMEAEEPMRRALKIDEASYGPDHPTVAIRLNNLAQLYQATNRLADAEEPMRRALKIDEACYGPNHPSVATRLNNLALLLKATNRLVEAEESMRRALKIDEASYGPDHPSVAIRLNNLASLLQTTNRLVEAEESMRRALKIDEASYGPDHPKVAIRLNNIATLLKATNRMAEAEEPMRRALKIDEASYGSDHPEVATALNNLAQLLRATSRLAEAEEPMRRVLGILAQFTAQTGHEHPRLGAVVGNYLGLLTESGQSGAEAAGKLLSALVEGGMSEEQIRAVFGS